MALISFIYTANTWMHAKFRWAILTHYGEIHSQSYVVILSRILLYVINSARVNFLKFVNKIYKVKIFEFLQRGPIVRQLQKILRGIVGHQVLWDPLTNTYNPKVKKGKKLQPIINFFSMYAIKKFFSMKISLGAQAMYESLWGH